MSRGRKKGSKNKGYFYRSGRGWYATAGPKKVPLLNEKGQHLRDPDAPEDKVREAHARFLLGQGTTPLTQENVSVLDVAITYLNYIKANESENTFEMRSKYLFDFCFGFPTGYRATTKFDAFRIGPQKEPNTTQAEKDRIHPGYGSRLVSSVKQLDIDRWLDKHPSWASGTKNIAATALIRAFNHCVGRGLISASPLKGYKPPKQRARVTYLTPEQEKLFLDASHEDLATAIQVCIRTGARCGKEFANLTSRHVKDHGERMEWVFKPEESKTKTIRRILITDPAIIEIVRERIATNTEGPLFRFKGRPWNSSSMSHAFVRAKRKLESEGHVFDDDLVMYSCRHTFAKRTLQGYWTGKPTNIETLAKLMGNSVEVCRRYYLQYSLIDAEHLWQAI